MSDFVLGFSLIASLIFWIYTAKISAEKFFKKDYCHWAIQILTFLGCVFLYWAFVGSSGWVLPFYSPYVFFIGTSLALMFTDISVQVLF